MREWRRRKNGNQANLFVKCDSREIASEHSDMQEGGYVWERRKVINKFKAEERKKNPFLVLVSEPDCHCRGPVRSKSNLLYDRWTIIWLRSHRDYWPGAAVTVAALKQMIILAHGGEEKNDLKKPFFWDKTNIYF